VTVPIGSADAAAELARLVPWSGAMWSESGPRVYVCDNFACQAPEHDPQALAATLGRLAARGREAAG
jgi:uncharacterized protein YyaL (SSP411 family)